MRGTGSAVAALLGLLLLASCALTPPVLGGRPGDGTGAPGEFSDDDLVTLLIVDDPEAENVVLDLADYRADADAGSTGCPDSAVPLVVLPDDLSARGSVVVSPPLFRDVPGADLVVAQVARRFDSDAEAAEFLEALRARRATCADVEIVDGDLDVDALGFASPTADGTDFEWVLVHANAALSLTAHLADADAADILHELAVEYAERLTAG